MSKLLWISLACLLACGSELDTFHVVRGDVALPVVVRGPKDAETLIVFQHGGPGAAELDGVYAFERALQERFLYASWGQRTSAYSTGRVTKKNSSLAQHYADMKAVLQVLRARYPEKRLVAVGYSFGGVVTLGHLGSSDAEPVDGVVLIDAPFGGEVVEREDFALLDAFAAQQIEEGQDVKRWQEFRALAEKQPEAYATLSAHAYVEQYALKRFDACLDMEKVLHVDDQPGPVESAGEIDPSAGLVIPDKFVPYRALDWLAPALVHYDLSEQAGRIEVPTLLLWGEHDCQVARPAAEALLEALGSQEKTLQIAPDTGHHLPEQAPDFVASEIERFIDGL